MKSKDKLCTTVQASRFGAKCNSFMPPHRKILGIEDTGKPSESVATGLHIDIDR